MIHVIQELSQSFVGIQLFAAVLAYFVALLVAISFHEFAHALAAHKAGDNTPKAQGRLTLNPTKHISGVGMVLFFIFGFGWAKPVEVNPTKFRNYKKSMTIVSLAGIITNIILAIISVTILGFLTMYGGTTFSNNLHLFFYHFLLYSSMLNTVLAAFNFLPVFPLDGFKFLEIWLKPNNAFLNFMRRYGHIMLIVFILTPIFDIVFGFIMLFVQTAGLFIPSLFL